MGLSIIFCFCAYLYFSLSSFLFSLGIVCYYFLGYFSQSLYSLSALLCLSLSLLVLQDIHKALINLK